MHFGFFLDLSDTNLWNLDLLDTHLDLLYTDITSKHFVWRRLQDMSSRHLQDTSSRHLQCNNFLSFKTSSRPLGRRKIVTLRACWRSLHDMSWRRLQDILKASKCLLGWPVTEESKHLFPWTCFLVWAMQVVRKGLYKSQQIKGNVC